VERLSRAPADGDRAPDEWVERLLAQIADRVRASATVEAAFGPPCTVGDRTVIPVARVLYGYGAGGGSGEPGGGSKGAAGSGGGGGAGVRVVPIAAIEIAPGGTRVLPIVDVATLATRAFVFAAVVALLGLLLGQRPERPNRHLGLANRTKS
jgi:uncharacterized spore protein YtfJ